MDVDWRRRRGNIPGAKVRGVAAKYAKTAGDGSGLVYDEFVQEAVESRRTLDGSRGTYLTAETAERINSVAKALGLRAQFVDTVEGGIANAQIQGDTVLIEKNNPNPVTFLMGHEITHRIQELAPEQYRSFRKFISENDADFQAQVEATQTLYENHGMEISYEKAMDEAAADYAGRLMEDGTLLDEFIQKNRKDKTLLEKVRDAIRSIIDVLTGREKQQAQTAEGKLTAALEAAAREADRVEVAKFSLKETTAEERKQYDKAASAEQSYERKNTQAEITVQYQQSVHDILNGASNLSDSLLVGYTPEVYQKLGMPDLPFVVGSGHVYSMAKTASEASAEGKLRRGTNYHGLGESVVADILDFVKDPVMVIAAKDVDANTVPMRSTHSVVALIDVGTQNESMVIPVAITAERKIDGIRMDVNAISSAYERNVAPLVNEAIAQFNAGGNSVFYVKKGAANLLGAGVQFPEQLKAAASSNGIVRKFDSKVNMSVQNVTESQQFKRWFGDWQNHPERASKVVNADGTPKVMYRGGNETFNIFDRKKSKYSNLYGRGFYFTDSESHARQYGDVRAYYLDVKHPLSTQDRTITRKQMRSFLEAVAENEDYGLENYGYGATVDSVLKDVYGKNDFSMLYDVNQTAIGDMVAAVELFNEVNGTGFDGLILDTETVVFNSSQIKSATDNVGTFDRNDPDIRFSLKSPVEETKDLVALHNLTEDKLLKSISLGGFPMPSIAVTRQDIPYTNFGDITLVMDKGAIDPKASRKNTVYSADAWTPTVPRVEYEADPKAEQRITAKLDQLGEKLDKHFRDSLHHVSYGMDELLNRYDGEAGVIEHAMENYGMKAAFLEEQGQHIDPITKQVEEDPGYSESRVEKYENVAKVLGGMKKIEANGWTRSPREFTLPRMLLILK